MTFGVFILGRYGQWCGTNAIPLDEANTIAIEMALNGEPVFMAKDGPAHLGCRDSVVKVLG